MTFRLYLNGAEVGAHAKVLKAEGWENVSVNYAHLRPKLPKRTPWTVAQRLPGMSVLLDAGGAAIDAKGWSQRELLEYAEELQAFTEDNADDLDLILEFDSKALGAPWIREQRRDIYADLGDKFIPIWHRELGMQELDKLADTYHRVGISEDDLNEQTGLAPRVNALVARYGTEFHAVASAKPDDLRQVRFATAATGSWLSPTRYGETLLWDGQKLHRYPARMKDQARRRHAAKTISRHSGWIGAERDQRPLPHRGVGAAGPLLRGDRGERDCSRRQAHRVGGHRRDPHRRVPGRHCATATPARPAR